MLDKFSEELLKIEKKHIDFFKNRKSKFVTDEYDRLHNHHITHWFDGKISFGFPEYCDLPENIKKECTDLFLKLFSKKHE